MSGQAFAIANATGAARSMRAAIVIFCALSAAWTLWWLAFWPGIVGQDGLAVLWQIEGKPLHSRKPLMWYLAVKGFYDPGRRVEGVVGLQMLLGALIYARILWWCWMQGMRKSFWLIGICICLSPVVLYYQSALYSDGLFATGVTGLTFEAWLIVQRRTLTRASLVWVALSLPLALFCRANGFVMLLLLAPMTWAIDGRSRLRLAAVLVFWLTAFAVGQRQESDWKSHGALFPLAVYETANFLQPSVMGLRNPNALVSTATRDALARHRPVSQFVAFFDRDYWDPLAYRADGPDAMAMVLADQKIVVREFWCCNVWRNLPAFVASRVNVFGVALLAQGGFGGPLQTESILPMTQSQSQIGIAALAGLRQWMSGYFDWSFSWRWLLWSPIPGLMLLAAVLASALRRKNWALLCIAAPLVVQLGGIFTFSVAGEYRYLLPFFSVAAALWPIYLFTRTQSSVSPGASFS